jgi:hypothetical protein
VAEIIGIRTQQSQNNLEAAVKVEIESVHPTIVGDYLVAVIGITGRVGYLHSDDEGILRFRSATAAADFVGKNRHGNGPLEIKVKQPIQAQGHKR